MRGEPSPWNWPAATRFGVLTAGVLGAFAGIMLAVESSRPCGDGLCGFWWGVLLFAAVPIGAIVAVLAAMVNRLRA